MSGEEDPTDVATRLLHRLRVEKDDDDAEDDTGTQNVPSPHKEEEDQHLIRTLAHSMTLFQEFCIQHLNHTRRLPDAEEACPCRQDPPGGGRQKIQFKARLVTTIGSQGTKCPLWHIDHVPVRWIQTMVGPGCEWVVGDEGVNWNILRQEQEEEEKEDNEQDNAFVTMSVNDRNRALVQDGRATIYAAKEQEALLLLGNQWPKYAKQQHILKEFQPVLHKSPTIPWGCERVLFTQDVLLPQQHHHLEGEGA